MGNYIFNKAKKSKTSSEADNSASSSTSKSKKRSVKMSAPIIIQPTIKQTASVFIFYN
jgi:hypothetical protein